MKTALNLTDLRYLSDLISMGVDLFIVGSKYSAYTSLRLDIEAIKDLRKRLERRKLYINVNGLYDEHELEGLFKHIDTLYTCHIDGLLFQDFAVLHYIKRMGYDLELMYAPMTLNTNSYTLNALKRYGITSAWIAKEIPLDEQAEIAKKAELPLMIQGHGVQYMASSKRPLVSHYEKASGLTFDHSNLTIHPRGEDFPCHIYEDSRGATIYTVNKLYTLDLLQSLKDFEYLYIETMYMSPLETVEVVNMYTDCIKVLNTDQYVRHYKEYLPMLRKISSPLDRGFIEDKTLYHLEDVKRRDNNG